MPNKIHYTKFFVLTTFIISLTILTQSIYDTHYFKDILLKKEYTIQTRELEQNSNNYRMIIKLAQEKALQLYKDLSINKLLFYQNLSPYDKMEANTQLAIYEASTPYLSSIYFYNQDVKTFYVKSGAFYTYAKDSFYDTYMIQLLDQWDNHYILKPRARIIKHPTGKLEPVYTIIYSEHSSNKQQKYAVVLNLSLEKIMEHLKSSAPNVFSNEFIIDSKGTLLSLSADGKEFGAVLSSEDYIQNILSNPKDQDYMIANIQDENYVVSYYRDNFYNWTYIYKTPSANLVRNVDPLIRRTWLITLTLLLIGLVISFFISKKYTKGIMKLGDQLEKVSKQLKTDSANLAYKELIHRLLQSKQGLTSLLNKIKPCILKQEALTVLCVSMDNYDQLKETHTKQDMELYQFILGNVGGELLETDFCCLAPLKLWNDGVIFIIGLSEGLYYDHLSTIILNYQDWIHHNMDFTITCAVGPLGDVEELSTLLHQSKTMLEHRLLHGPEGYFYYRQYDEDWSMAKSTIDGIQDRLYLGLKKADIYSAMSSLNQLNQLKCETPSALLYLYNQFCFTLSTIIQQLNLDLGIHLTFNLKKSILDLNQFDYRDQLHQYISVLIQDYCHQVATSLVSQQQNSTVNQILCILKEQYSQPELSIQSIAEQIGLSTSHLSRVFKKELNQTILQALVDIRMGKARHDLTHSQKSIAVIAEESGFSSTSYFYKVFKKAHHLTPLEYKQQKSPHLLG